jgi:hypothetical protein
MTARQRRYVQGDRVHRDFATEAVPGSPPEEPSIVITSNALDYQGDIVEPDGLDASNYLRAGGPVLLFHDSQSLPVGTCTSLTRVGGKIRATWKWLTGDARADAARNAFQQGALGGASIGFSPKEPYAETMEMLADGGVRWLKTWLHEFSLTTTPANAECVKILKGLGLDPAEVPVKRPAARAPDTAPSLSDAHRSSLLLMRDQLKELTKSVTKARGVLVARDQQVLRSISKRLDALLGAVASMEPEHILIDGEAIEDKSLTVDGLVLTKENLAPALSKMSDQMIADIVLSLTGALTS